MIWRETYVFVDLHLALSSVLMKDTPLSPKHEKFLINKAYERDIHLVATHSLFN